MTAQEYIDGCIARTARKSWRCDGDGSSRNRHATDCPRDINPGDKYIEYLGTSHAYESGSRHSLSCAKSFLSGGNDG